MLLKYRLVRGKGRRILRGGLPLLLGAGFEPVKPRFSNLLMAHGFGHESLASAKECRSNQWFSTSGSRPSWAGWRQSTAGANGDRDATGQDVVPSDAQRHPWRHVRHITAITGQALKRIRGCPPVGVRATMCAGSVVAAS